MERGVPAEQLGAQVLQPELAAGATLDIHAAVQLSLYMALARGRSAFRVLELSSRARTTLWLLERLFPFAASCEAAGGAYGCGSAVPMNTDDQVKALLDLVATLAAELRPGLRTAVTLDSALDRDLGFDSLARVELLLRCERFFNVNLPEQTLATVETPRDLLRAVLSAGVAPRPLTAAEMSEIVVEQVSATPERAATLLEMLDWHVAAHGERTHIVLSEETGEELLSYQALRVGAEALAAGLQSHDMQPGQTVAIMLPTGRDYFYSFYGVLLAGAIPVPIYPPARLSQIEDHLRRHAGILNNAAATLLITVPEARPLAQLLKSHVESLRSVATPQELSSSGTSLVRVARKADDIALLQYTSASTGNPKGVVLTHANLLANIRAMGRAAQAEASDIFVSWLPLYHDMGLIGAWLGTLYHAIPFVVMSPLSFLARPERWLWAIHHHRGTLSAAPNFAYELCLRKIDDRAIAGLDLSSWRMAFNGAEPVSPDTIVNFQQRYGRYGLRAETLAPVYGLAESAVGLAFPPPGRGPIIDRIRREPFMRTVWPLPPPSMKPMRCVSWRAAGHCPATLSASSMPPAMKWASARKGAWNSAVLPSPPVIFAIRSRPVASFTTAGTTRGWTPVTWPTPPPAISISPAAPRTSSSAPGATYILTNWKRRWAISPAYARVASRYSAAPIPPPAPNAWWCWRRRAKRSRWH